MSKSPEVTGHHNSTKLLIFYPSEPFSFVHFNMIHPVHSCKLFSYPRVRNLTTHLTLMRTLTSSTQFMLSTRQTRLSSHFLSTSSNLVGTDKFIIQTNYPCTAVEFRKDKITLSYGCTSWRASPCSVLSFGHLLSFVVQPCDGTFC